MIFLDLDNTLSADDEDGIEFYKIIRNIFSIMLKETLNLEDRIRLNSTLNHLLNFFLPKIDDLELSEESKDAMKNLLKLYMTVFFKKLVGEDLSSEYPRKFANSLVKLFVSFNNSLLKLADQFLSNDQTTGELDTESKHLLGLIFRNVLATILSKFEIIEDQLEHLKFRCFF